MRPVSAWGRLSAEPHLCLPLRHRNGVAAQLAQGGASAGPAIAHGMGRSYGDQALNPGGRLWVTRGLDRLIAFDAERGVLEAEAGLTLGEIAAWALPRGWFLPVMPGTQFVTLGGAVANDVHGKNHHLVGSFGHHVEGLELVRSDGRTIACAAAGENADWQRATIGGMGLTGLVTRVRLRLSKVGGPWIESSAEPLASLGEALQRSHAANADPAWPYTVTWFDASRGPGAFRGLLLRGRHLGDPRDLPPRRPRRLVLTPPLSLVTRFTTRNFDRLYFRLNSVRGTRREPWPAFFCPLDAVLDWNRVYGSAGFFQYQCVLPRAVQEAAAAELLDRLARAGQRGHASFLGVLKTFGDAPDAGLLSFPMPGITIAVDLPHRGEQTLRLLAELDAVVAAAGGRLYPAKDARMPRALFEAGYPRLAEFQRYRDAGCSSAMSRRLMGS